MSSGVRKPHTPQVMCSQVSSGFSDVGLRCPKIHPAPSGVLKCLKCLKCLASSNVALHSTSHARRHRGSRTTTLKGVHERTGQGTLCRALKTWLYLPFREGSQGWEFLKMFTVLAFLPTMTRESKKGFARQRDY